MRGNPAAVFAVLLTGLFAGVSAGIGIKYNFNIGEEGILAIFIGFICSITPVPCSMLFFSLSLVFLFAGVVEAIQLMVESGEPAFAFLLYIMGLSAGFLLGIYM